MTALSDLHGIYLIVGGVAAILLIGAVAKVRELREKRRSDFRRAEDAILIAQREATRPVMHAPDTPGFISGHDWSTGREPSTGEIGKTWGQRRSTRFHSGPRNDHEL